MLGGIAAGSIALAVAGALALNAGGASQAGREPSCKPGGSLQRMEGLSEASGLAVSRTTTERLWAHNDSGQPVLHAVDLQGKVSGQVKIDGARLEDWEALSIGSCGSSGAASCLYIADIGDNDAERRQITIYRLAEPDSSATSAKVADVFHASYPDGAHDAEALLVGPGGAMFVVTKGSGGPVALYRFPRDLKPGAAVRLERVGDPMAAKPARPDRITDGAMSMDGEWVALRTLQSITFYRAADFLRGDFTEAHRVDLSTLREPQGEAVAFGADGTVFVAGEGGGKGLPGTLGVLSCRF